MASRSASVPAFRIPAYSVQAAGISPNVTAIAWPAGEFGVDTLQYKVYSDGVFLRNIALGVNGTTETGLAAGTTKTYEVLAESNAHIFTWGGSVTVTTLPASPVVFEATIEEMPLSGTTATPGWFKQALIESDIAPTTAKARAGVKSLGFNFQYVDWALGDLGLRRNAAPALGYEATLGEDSWTGFSLFIDDTWEADFSDNREILCQWHGQSGGPARLSPPLAVFGQGDQIAVNLCAADATYDCAVASPSAVALVSLDLIDLRGRWTDWVFKIKWDYTDGTVEVWLDGDRIVDYAGPTLYRCTVQPNELGPQWGCGPYKWNWGVLPTQVGSRIMYIDEVRFGDQFATYDDVMPRGAP